MKLITRNGTNLELFIDTGSVVVKHLCPGWITQLVFSALKNKERACDFTETTAQCRHGIQTVRQPPAS